LLILISWYKNKVKKKRKRKRKEAATDEGASTIAEDMEFMLYLTLLSNHVFEKKLVFLSFKLFFVIFKSFWYADIKNKF
jgi:hypothetical protein